MLRFYQMDGRDVDKDIDLYESDMYFGEKEAGKGKRPPVKPVIEQQLRRMISL